MKTLFAYKTLLFSAALTLALSSSARAAAILNGGFETGLTGWTTADQTGSEGSFVQQSGTTSPLIGDPVPAPPGGSSAAMTDAFGPGSHVLYQMFLVDSLFGSANLAFDLFVGNRGEAFFTSATLDFATPALNQQARVDILAGGADPFSLAAGDVLMNLFQTNPGDPLVSGYTTYSTDITQLLNNNLGNTLMLRFAETDNVFPFQYGVDNVVLSTSASAIPEPSTWVLTSGALLAMVWAARRRRNVA